VVLAHGTVLREAAEQDKTPADHLSHLVVHGVLHLLGFDHENEAEAEAMEGLEVAVLTGLGIADPYRPPDLSDSENETEMEVVKARR
jgi:probable rRNA maturation factor